MDISKVELNELIEKIKEHATTVLNSLNLTIYKIKKVTDYGVNTIQILVNEEGLDVDILGLATNNLLDVINDLLPDDYYLEISTKGLEAPIETEEEYLSALNKYIFVSLYEKHPEILIKEIYGTLLEINEETITLEVLLKTRKKTITIEKKKIANARLAVKF